MRHGLAFALGATLLSGGCAPHRTPEAPLPEATVAARVDSSLSALTKRGFAGAVLLMERGDTLLHKGYGLADRGTRRPMAAETGFDIGSLVKPITMAAVLKLESQGRLHVTDRLDAFLPRVPPDKAAITVLQLLRHSSGLPDIVDEHLKPVRYTPDFDCEPVSRDEIVRRAMGAKLLFAPGSGERYSNLGYSLLGAIVEIASGEPYETYVHREILAPAGMTRTGYLAPGWRNEDLAVGYVGDRAWGTPLDHRWLPDGPSWNLRGNGGMISTSGDLGKWIAALGSGSFLPPRQHEEFLDMTVTRNKRGARKFGPAGGNDVFNACYLWYLDEDRTIVVLTSCDSFKAEDLVPHIAHEMRRIALPR